MDGGYKYCKRLALHAGEDLLIAQVSINMVNLEKFRFYRVFETVRFEVSAGVANPRLRDHRLAPAE